MTIDLVLATEGHMAQFRDSVNSIYYNILKDGKVAYEQHASDTQAQILVIKAAEDEKTLQAAGNLRRDRLGSTPNKR